MTGRLIVHEGIDGGGKSGVAAHMVEVLKHQGQPAMVLAALDKTLPITLDIRDIMLEGSVVGDHELVPSFAVPDSSALLARGAVLHIEQTIMKHYLDLGYWVFMDRWRGSTKAYQCAEGVDAQAIYDLYDFGKVREPDLEILFHVSPEIGLARAGRDDGQYEARGEGYMQKVSDEYDDYFANKVANGVIILTDDIDEETTFETVEYLLNLQSLIWSQPEDKQCRLAIAVAHAQTRMAL